MLDVLRVRGALYLLIGVTLGRLPQAMSAFAIVRLVVDQGGAYSLASLITGAYVIASTVGQPVLARLIDRTGRSRLILLASALVASAALVGLAFTAVTAPVLGVLLALLAGFATPPLESSLRSLWVRIMQPGKQLHTAFSLDAAAQEVLFIAGPLMTSLGILLFGVQGTMLFMAALGIGGTLFFAVHPHLRRSEPLAAETPARGRVATPLTIAGFRRLLLFQFSLAVPVGVLTITATGFAELQGDEGIGAWALSINALGALIGAVVSARWPLPWPAYRMLRWLGLAFATLYLPTMVTGAGIVYWFGAALVAGILLPVTLTQVFSQTERAVPAAQLNEANAWTISAFSAGIATGTILAGPVVDALGVAAGIAAAVAIGSAITVLGALAATPRALKPVEEESVDEKPTPVESAPEAGS